MARYHQQSPGMPRISKKPVVHTGAHPLVALARVLARSAAREFLDTSGQLGDDSANPPGSGEHSNYQARSRR